MSRRIGLLGLLVVVMVLLVGCAGTTRRDIMKSKDQGTAEHYPVNTKNDYARIIQKLIEGIDMDSDLERKKAFNKCVEYAEKELKDNSDYNYFLSMAAKILGQPPIFKDITASIQAKGDEKLYLFYAEGHGPELCGNESGLSYLSEILRLLSKSKLDVDHVHLDHILYGNSYPLTIWKERDTWFAWFEKRTAKKEAEPEKPIPRRDLDPSEIRALLFPVPLRDEIAPEISGIPGHLRFSYPGNGERRVEKSPLPA